MERILAGTFGFTFCGVGLAVLGFLWLSPFGHFHSPPLFFRIFGSFIAIPFVAIGGTALYTAITGKSMIEKQFERLHQFARELQKHAPSSDAPFSPGSLACPHCGAPIGQAEISPSGDVKCTHCNNWYNVRK